MQNLKTHLFILFLFVSFSVSAQQKLLVGGSGWNQVAIVDKNSANIEWTYDLPEKGECNHVRFTQDGDILFSYKKGARLVNKSKETIWDFKANEGEEVHTAKQLPNGNYFLGICAQPSRFITLSKKGKKISEQNYDLGIAKNHGQFRQVTPTTNGTIIIPVLGKSEIIEIDKNNSVLTKIKIEGNLFAVKVLPNKKWLVACGDAHKFVIVDPKKEKIVKEYTNDFVKGCSLNFVADPQFLKNGNFLIANWNGHSKDKTQPKIVEIDKKGKVVWTLPHNEEIRNISSVDFQKD
jgi:hypothetical protein